MQNLSKTEHIYPDSRYVLASYVRYFTKDNPQTNGSPNVLTAGENIGFFNVQNRKKCRICLQEDHEPGSQLCSEYTDTQEEVVSFAGAKNPLSNFYPCTINVFGISHSSAEHAFQYVKALRCGSIEKAQLIQESATALDAKKTKEKYPTK
jgi:hypothetical protein